MLTIILGFVVAGIIFVVGFALCYYFDFFYNNFGSEVTILLALIVVIYSLIGGIHRPLQGYSERVLTEEISLVSFSEKETSDDYGIFLHSDGKSSYTIKYILNKNEKNSKLYETYTFNAEPKDIKEYDECKEPVLRKYTSEPVREIWTFALGCREKVEYEVHVPKDSIRYLK